MKTRYRGFFIQRRYCWVPTLYGWLTLLFITSVTFVFFIKTIVAFLAPTHTVRCDLLVVEGWLPDYALERTIGFFAAHHCQRYVTTGTRLSIGSHFSAYKTWAEVAAVTLKRLGVADNLIVAVPVRTPTTRNRTYASAIALKRWLSGSEVTVSALNVYSLGVHARRSWLLFQKALGDGINVGIVAGKDRSYDPQRWWASSQGLRAIIGETIAYLHARFLFFP